MFLPDNLDQYEKEEKERKAALNRIEKWSLEMIPEEIRKDVFVAVREMACGDPSCSPIDTAITILFERCGRLLLDLHCLCSFVAHLFQYYIVGFSRCQQWSRWNVWSPHDGKRCYKRRSRT